MCVRDNNSELPFSSPDQNNNTSFISSLEDNEVACADQENARILMNKVDFEIHVLSPCLPVLSVRPAQSVLLSPGENVDPCSIPSHLSRSDESQGMLAYHKVNFIVFEIMLVFLTVSHFIFFSFYCFLFCLSCCSLTYAMNYEVVNHLCCIALLIPILIVGSFLLKYCLLWISGSICTPFHGYSPHGYSPPHGYLFHHVVVWELAGCGMTEIAESHVLALFIMSKLGGIVCLYQLVNSLAVSDPTGITRARTAQTSCLTHTSDHARYSPRRILLLW